MYVTRLHLTSVFQALLVTLIIVIPSSQLQGQDTTWNEHEPHGTLSRIDFIMGSSLQGEVMNIMEQAELIQPEKSAPSLIDELEFRLSNDELDARDQRYDFRLRPNNPTLRNRTKELYDLRKKQLQADAELALSDEILIRYELILDWLELHKKSQLLDEKININNQRLDWLKQYPGADFFDADTYTESVMEKLELWSQRAELDLKLAALNRVVQQKVQSNKTPILLWDKNFDLSAEYIQHFMASLPSTFDEHRKLYLAELAIQEIELENKVDKASVDLGFIQAEYFPNRVNKSLIGLSAGITLPLFQTDRADLMDNRLESKEREFELFETRQQISYDVQRWKEHLHATLNYYLELRANYESINLSELTNTLQSLDEFEPLKGLELKELELKWQEIEQEWYLEIVRSYIGLLSQLDWLSTYKDIDWLSTESVSSFRSFPSN